jgi:hypothetical protein
VLQIALAAVMEGGTPDVSEDDTLGTVQIRDPYEERDYLDGKAGPAPARTKVVSLRDDLLGRFYVRGQILECHYVAGRQWQRDYELAEISNLRAIDFTKDVVDGGKLADPLSDSRIRAMANLARYDRALGRVGAALVRQTLGKRMFMDQVVAARGDNMSQRNLDFLAKRLKECLDTLAEEMGLATRGR